VVTIHPSSVVDSNAQLAEGVKVGPFCYIEPDVEVGPYTILDSHVTLKSGTQIGSKNFVGQGSVLGSEPQDKNFQGERSFLVVGDENIIREYVTLHRATGEDQATQIGSYNYLMAFSHIGHNGHVGDYVTLANNVGVSGRVTLEDYVNIGGMTGVHQGVYIGKAAMIGGMSGITRDIPPYALVSGRDHKIYGINAVGLRRLGMSRESRTVLQRAFKILFMSGMSLTHAAELVRAEFELTPELLDVLKFVENENVGSSGRSRSLSLV
jgi:UDP-N-acetylglucosamine acyltransferase